MALTIQRANRVESFNNPTASPVQQSSRVEMRVFNPGLDSDAGAMFNGTIWVLNTEPMTWGVETSWKDSAGATIAKKIDDLMNSAILKMLAGDKMFNAVVTDAWSQKVAEHGSPMSAKLKFRAYYDKVQGGNATASHDYKFLIRFFTRMCAPPKKYSLDRGIFGGIKAAADNARETFSEIKKAATYTSNEDGKDYLDMGKAAAYTIAAAGTNFAEPGANGDNALRCQYTLVLNTEKFGYSSLDWIVKGFTWTPSQQMVIEGGKPMPLWVDFDVDLETNICPSNAYVGKFFAKSSASIV